MILTAHASRLAHDLVNVLLDCKAGDGRPYEDPWIQEKRDRNDNVYLGNLNGVGPDLRDYIGWMDLGNLDHFWRMVAALPDGKMESELYVACESFRREMRGAARA
jgi:hypothetical protein